MGWLIDLVAAIFIIVIMLYVFARLGITLQVIISLAHKFFSGSSSNTTAGVISLAISIM